MEFRSVIIIGAGGHGKVVADIAQLSGLKVVGFADDVVTGEPLPDLPVLYRIADIPDGSTIILGIGDNQARRRIAESLAPRVLFATIIHHTCTVSKYATIGEGSVLMPGAVVKAVTTIGNHVILNTNCAIGHDCVIGNYVHVGPGANVSGNVQIGDGVLIGVGSCIIPGVRIGAGSIIGAGSVVVHDVPDGVTAYGVPATVKCVSS